MGFYNHLLQRWSHLDRSALLLDQKLDYQEVVDGTQAAAAFLKSEGLFSGDVLALQLSSSLEFILLTLGALSQGIAVLPLNPTYREEINFFLEDAQAKLFIAERTQDQAAIATRILSIDEVFLKGTVEPIEVDDDSLAFLLYTSGTTGKPKGAYITHSNLLATVTALHEAWAWTPQDRMLHVLPLFHVHGLFVGLLTALYAGAMVEIEGSFQAESVLSKIAQGETTVFMGVPTIYYRLLSFLDGKKCNPGNVRIFTCGSAPLPTTLHRAFEAGFSHRILERYGMTEVGIVLSNPYEGERKIGSVGFPIGDTTVEVRDKEGRVLEVGDVGELWHSGSSVISKYLNRPLQSAETIQAGWLRSGDLGYRDADGYFFIIGRAKDMIISGGFNIYPREIEALLLEHESIEEAAVIGIEDEEWGEIVTACLVGSEQATLTELQLFLRAKMASYKIPRKICWLSKLPRNAMGKIEKAKLRALFSSQEPLLR